MKKIICMVLAMMFLAGGAWAEETGTEAWQHEAGWLSFSLALAQDGLEEVWNEAAKTFGESMNLSGLSGEQLKMMMLQGHVLENGVEDLSVDGSRITGKKADGTELFSHEYAPVDVIEDENILNGTKVHVFMTEEAGAGAYTYLLMTEPVKTEGETAGYITFNLIFSQADNYREKLDKEKGTGAAICALIEKDTSNEGLAYAIERLFASPVVISK